MPTSKLSKVYVVQHVHEFPDGTEDVKFIGVYSSRVAAEAAVARAVTLPGFSESRDGFSIDEYDIDSDSWTEGFITVE